MVESWCTPEYIIPLTGDNCGPSVVVNFAATVDSGSRVFRRAVTAGSMVGFVLEPAVGSSGVGSAVVVLAAAVLVGSGMLKSVIMPVTSFRRSEDRIGAAGFTVGFFLNIVEV